MTEQEAYVKQMDAEKQRLDARIAETEAQADVRQASDELKDMSAIRRVFDTFRSKLDALSKRETRNFDQGKAELRKSYDDANQAVIEMDAKMALVRAGYERKREAELRALGAQMDGWDASISQSRAEDSRLTRQELQFVRRSLNDTEAALRRLMSSHGADWSKLKKDYEDSWRELRERSEKIRAGEEVQPSSPA
ncbi:hypothetical protein [Corallococcus macrosporus]|uniref:Uncharacterized protein n=1 Tax=Myxococcus fulvus (strain ATCC BAA-855 / HW-1) TaxID=483219 RepID=F8CP43_MYXFH|nr:hypothetical protein [Corallococcus macrosporus]AEI66621.1 hypothetical protein LILAB_23630 [Corallococcus macrosporus]